MNANQLTNEISKLAGAAFEQATAAILSGVAPRTAIANAMAGFEGQYTQALSKAFSGYMTDGIGSSELRSYSVGRVVLSDALYLNAREVATAVEKVITDHTRWEHSVRELAKSLYEGYGFRDTEVLKAAVGLPKYMRDAKAEKSIAALLARIQASSLKTEALKAGYLEALEKILKGADDRIIKKAMRVAMYERIRFFANRIAQTELARLQIKRAAHEFFSFGELTVLQFRMSITHPKEDICDVFARSNPYGLGVGCYPKGLAPCPPLHPFCRCSLSPRLDLDADNPTDDVVSFSDFLRSQSPQSGARMAGSYAKRDEVLNGASVVDVYNRTRPFDYQMRTVNDLVNGVPAPIVPAPPAATSSVFHRAANAVSNAFIAIQSLFR